ncbi:hypothetical protein ACOSQ4_004278 [Xanthoceras sorbifolium]
MEVARRPLLNSNEVQTLLLRYERMPEFCFDYGLIGHSVRECPSSSSINSTITAS